MSTEGLRTTDALAYAGLDRTLFNSVVQRQLLTDLPPAVPGRIGRHFGPDDLVPIKVFAELLRIGVMLYIAARIADDLRGWLRTDGRVKTLHLITAINPDGTTRAEIVKHPATDATVLWAIDVAKARHLAREAIAQSREQ